MSAASGTGVWAGNRMSALSPVTSQDRKGSRAHGARVSRALRPIRAAEPTPFCLTLVVILSTFQARPAHPARPDCPRRGALPVTKKEIVRRISDRAELTQL